MKKIARVAAFTPFCFLLITFGGTCQAQAEGRDNYFVLRGGLAIPQDIRITASGEGSGSTMSFENGYVLGAAYGRRLLPWLRGEIEVGWMSMDADSLKTINRGTEIDDKGKDDQLFGMINVMADLQNDSAFTPYAGLGLGLSNARLENTFVWPGNGQEISRDSSDTVFAYQFMAGVLWDIDTSWGLELRGRYFGSEDRTHDNHPAGTSLEINVEGSEIWMFDVGVRYTF